MKTIFETAARIGCLTAYLKSSNAPAKPNVIHKTSEAWNAVGRKR